MKKHYFKNGIACLMAVLMLINAVPQLLYAETEGFMESEAEAISTDAFNKENETEKDEEKQNRQDTVTEKESSDDESLKASAPGIETEKEEAEEKHDVTAEAVSKEEETEFETAANDSLSAPASKASGDGKVYATWTGSPKKAEGNFTYNYIIKSSENGSTIATMALCVNASRLGPDGVELPYSKQKDSSDTSVLLKAAYIRNRYPSEFRPGTGSIPDDSVLGDFWYGLGWSTNKLWVACHVLVSWEWANDIGGSNGIGQVNAAFFNNHIKPMKQKILGWYKDNTDCFKDIIDSYDLFVADGSGKSRHGVPLQSVAWAEKKPQGSAEVLKESADPDRVASSSKYSLKGAVYGIYKTRAQAQAASDREEETGKEVGLLTTKADGSSNSVLLNPGTYYIAELSPSKGHETDKTIHTAVVKAGESCVIASTEPVVTNPVQLLKKSANPALTNGKKAYSLKGALYGIYGSNADAREAKNKAASGDQTATGKERKILKTNADGESNSVTLGIGTYYAVEYKAPKGFKLDPTIYTITVTENTDEDIVIESIEEPITVPVRVLKVPARPEVVKNNNCYSLAGAEYGIYGTRAKAQSAQKSESATGDELAILVTKADGTTDPVVMPPGVYYVAEYKASKGYLPDETIHTLNLTAESENVTVKSVEEPLMDPAGIMLDKVPAGDRDNTTADMTGAEYTVKYYAGNASNGKPYTSSNLPESATCTWIIKTIRTGSGRNIAILDDDHLVSGARAPFGENDRGWYMLPLGTITVKETKAPRGYLLDNTLMLANITEDGHGEVFYYGLTNMTDESTADGLQIIHEEAQIKIKTSAFDTHTQSRTGSISEGASVTDSVTYENLAHGGSYLFVGTLRFADTGEIVTGTDGKPCITSKLLKVSYSASGVQKRSYGYIGPKDGTVEMDPFIFNAVGFEGRTVVVTEELYDYDLYDEDEDDNSEALILQHFNLEDESQSVHFPGVETNARDLKTGSKTAAAGKKETIIDKVTITNAVFGNEYVIEGALLYNSDGVDAKGIFHKQGDIIAKHEPVTVIADSNTITLELSFEVDSAALSGLSGVVFEEVYHNGIRVCIHHDYDSKLQTPNWPKIKTSASDAATGSHTGLAGTDCEIVDTVSLYNLTVGDTYRVEGMLMFQSGKPFTVAGKPLIVSGGEFIAESRDMTIEHPFVFDASGLEDVSLVIFEKLFAIGNKDEEDEEGRSITGRIETMVACHENLDDPAQTVSFISAKTAAADGKTDDRIGTEGKEESIIDYVYTRNLTIGEEYTIKGSLHYKEDFVDARGSKHFANEAVTDQNGDRITAIKTFIAEEKNPVIELCFKLDTTLLAGAAIVAFEDIYTGAVLLYSHADIMDEEQTVYYPKIKTVAADVMTGSHTGAVSSKTMIKDDVTYDRLIPQKTYSLEGTLMIKETGKPLLIDGRPAVKKVDFTPKEPFGIYTLSFDIDAFKLAGLTVVVFERLYYNETEVASHTDMDDEDQSVHYPEIKTMARVDGIQNATAGKRITVTDTISYRNLIPGREYVIKGKLMDKSAQKELAINGKSVAAKRLFIPEGSDGTITLDFIFDTGALGNMEIVVFEELYEKDILIASHADINDREQTIIITEAPKTGDGSGTGLYMYMLGLSAIAFTALTAFKKRGS